MMLFNKFRNNSQRYHHIYFYNWWDGNIEDVWLYKFIVSRNLNTSRKPINFISVFGDKKIINKIKEGHQIFYTGENIHSQFHLQYSDYLLNNQNIDLALGFDYFENPRYIRFPLWIQYILPPNATDEEIVARCQELRHPDISKKSKFASIIARYDWDGRRKQIYDRLNKVGDISCPSAMFHNDDSLKTIFNDNKIEYLQQFWFNICPENSNSYGYVTEKIFEAIESGCIPIYWGSYNKPEEGILNKDAMILWDMQSDNTENIKLIQYLIADPNRLKDFCSQPRLMNGAEDIIIETINKLKKKILTIIND